MPDTEKQRKKRRSKRKVKSNVRVRNRKVISFCVILHYIVITVYHIRLQGEASWTDKTKKELKQEQDPGFEMVDGEVRLS